MPLGGSADVTPRDRTDRMTCTVEAGDGIMHRKSRPEVGWWGEREEKSV